MHDIQIAVVGGGFGGLYTALELEKLLKREQGVSITLFNDENFFLFTPMLAEAAASTISTRHVVSPIRKLLHRSRFVEMSVEGIDLDARVISARHCLTNAPRQFVYDHLVIALGGVTNYFNVPGAAEHSIPIKTLGDALFVRNHVIDQFERAAVQPEVQDELLTIVVVGGGLTGVEVVGALNDFARAAAKYYPEIHSDRIRIMLVEALPRLLPDMSEDLAHFAKKTLIERGVDVRTSTSVVRAGEGYVELSTGEHIPTHTLIWGAGVAANPLLAGLNVPKERGRVRTNEYLEVEGANNVWALGDCAYIPDPTTGKAYPPTAQHAVREGKIAARNIAAKLGIGTRKVFEYKSKGQMALIGERTGIAEIMGYRFSGFFAWLLWRTYYLMQVPLLEKRIRILMDWTADLFFTPDIVQLGITRARQLEPTPRAVAMISKEPTLSNLSQRIPG